MKRATKRYYILDPSFNIIPLEDYKFSKNEFYLRSVITDECLEKKFKLEKENPNVKKILQEMGFEREPLSEPGHLRVKGYGVTILEAIEQYSWNIAKEFCEKEKIPVYKIKGGELYNSNIPEIKKHLSLLLNAPSLYGENFYKVFIENKELILRYSGCTQKLSIAKDLDLSYKNLPIGLFEISKSYRFEKENELENCYRLRSFHLPELHVLSEGLSQSLKIALSVYSKILEEISKLELNWEIVCGVTENFFKKQKWFLKSIINFTNKPVLLVIYNRKDFYEDGVEVNIDYKLFNIQRIPLEMSTFQVDDGTTIPTFNVKYHLHKKLKPVSTIHAVFIGSIERFVYFNFNRIIKKMKNGEFLEFPFWMVPIQIRIIPFKRNCLKEAEKIAKKLEEINLRVDVDDREISFAMKKKAEELKWIPYIITIYKKKRDDKYHLKLEDKFKRINKILDLDGLIKEMRMKSNTRIVVPRYTPLFLSKRFLF
jgi:threonyl-tRNA synthetase